MQSPTQKFKSNHNHIHYNLQSMYCFAILFIFLSTNCQKAVTKYIVGRDEVKCPLDLICQIFPEKVLDPVAQQIFSNWEETI